MKPTPLDRNLWKRALMEVLNLNPQQAISQKLGKWWRTNKPQHGWYIDQVIPRLYNWDRSYWTFHIQIPRQTRGLTFQRQKERVEPVQQWERWDRATVICTQHLVKVSGTGWQTQKPKQPEARWIKNYCLQSTCKSGTSR